MSYKINVYFNDENVTSTTIFNAYAGINKTYKYDSSQYVVSGLMGVTRFTAVVDDSFDGVRWYYRLGSGTSEPLYHYDSYDYENDFAFEYSEEDELFIRAEAIMYGDEPDEPDEPDVPDVPIIAKWDWEGSNWSAYEEETLASYYALKNKEDTRNFNYKVWNDLVFKTYEILDYADADWNDEYDTFRNTLMTSDDKELTARRFNSLRFNIGSWYSTGIDEVVPGNEVLARYFLTLASCINGWIDLLS